MTLSAGSPFTRLREALDRSRVPELVMAAWTAPPPDPASGQLWRARWDDRLEFVLIVETSDRGIQAAPVSLETQFADDATVVLDPDDTTLAVALAVWTALTAKIPMRVLDRMAGVASVAGLTKLESAGAPADRTQRSAIVAAVDPRAEYRALLGDTMTTFTNARWASEGTGRLPQVLSEAGVDHPQLENALGSTPQVALQVLRGLRAISYEEAGALEPLTGISAADLLAANPPLPEDLVAELDRPTRRATVQQLAHRRQLSETAAWNAAGYGALAASAAARQTGLARDIDWAARLDRYFAVVAGE